MIRMRLNELDYPSIHSAALCFAEHSGRTGGRLLIFVVFFFPFALSIFCLQKMYRRVRARMQEKGLRGCLNPFSISSNRHPMRNEMKNWVKRSSPGYIMIFALLIIGALMVIVTYIGHRGSYYLPFAKMAVEREKAKMLAVSGIQVAIAQLAEVPKKENKKESSSAKAGVDATADAEPAVQGEKDFLVRILPTLNRWQHFDLKEEVDGVDGRMSICLVCEEGKINLNRMIDFKKNTFRGSEKSGWKVLMQEICKSIERVSKSGDLFATFEKIVKEAKFPFNDATELITKKEFNFFKDNLFYQPPTTKKHDTIYLTDIFTVWSSSDKLEPWLFSDSMNALFGLPRVEVDDIKKRKEQVEGWAKNFKTKSNWSSDWQTILMPVYAKELRTLPKNIDSKLSTTFDPHFFSVLVHGKVGEVTQIVYAILERNKRTEGDAVEYDVVIKKLYWL
jgi:hypothetical protein